MASSVLMRVLDHTQRRTTVGRTLLNEWSARRRDLYLITHNTHNRQTSMPPVGFEPTISAGKRPQTYALDCAAPGTGKSELLIELKILRRRMSSVLRWRCACNVPLPQNALIWTHFNITLVCMVLSHLTVETVFHLFPQISGAKELWLWPKEVISWSHSVSRTKMQYVIGCPFPADMKLC